MAKIEKSVAAAVQRIDREHDGRLQHYALAQAFRWTPPGRGKNWYEAGQRLSRLLRVGAGVISRAADA